MKTNDIEKLQKLCREQANIIKRQAAVIERLCQRVEELEALLGLTSQPRPEVDDLAQGVKDLPAPPGTNSTNSSMPPSSDGPAARAQRRHLQKALKVASDRKRGAQPGHKPHQRQLLPLDRVDHVIATRPQQCTACQAALTGDDPNPLRHQVFEIPPIKPVVTEFQLHRLTCACCGTLNKAHWHHDKPAGQLGARATAILTTLRIKARQSVAQTQQLMDELFGLHLSTGLVSKTDHRVSEQLKQPYEALHEHLLESARANLDETVWYQAGERQVLWCGVTAHAVWMMLRDNRKQEQAKELIGEHYKGVATSDRYPGYNFLDKLRRQFCWAHVLREFMAMSQSADEKVNFYGYILLCTGRRVMSLWGRYKSGQLSREELKEQVEGKKPQMKMWLKEVSEVKGEEGGVARALLKHFESLWVFVEHEGVEPTNNAAERALRHAVLLRKTSFGSQSERGLRFVERVLSVFETLKRQQRSFFSYIHDLLIGSPQPLLPAALPP